VRLTLVKCFTAKGYNNWIDRIDLIAYLYVRYALSTSRPYKTPYIRPADSAQGLSGLSLVVSSFLLAS